MALTHLAETSIHRVLFFFSVNRYQCGLKRWWHCSRSRNVSYLLTPRSSVCRPCLRWPKSSTEWWSDAEHSWLGGWLGRLGNSRFMTGDLGGIVTLHLLWQELFPKESLYIVKGMGMAPISMGTLWWLHPLGFCFFFFFLLVKGLSFYRIVLFSSVYFKIFYCN